MVTDLEQRQKQSTQRLDYFRKHPDLFIEKRLGTKLWSGMRLVIKSVFENKRTSVKGCHGISKTKLAADIAIAFLNLYKEATVITTAPSNRTVEKLLWKEIRKTYLERSSFLRGECQTLQVKVTPDCYMLGFSTDTAVNIEGWHAPHILFILDEAKGIESWVYDALNGSMMADCHMLEISTTDGADQQTPFRKHHTTERGEWKCFSFSAFDSPYVNPKDYPKYQRYMNQSLFRHGRYKTRPEWHKERGAEIAIADDDWILDRWKWQDTNLYMWQTKVLGEFADLGEDNIIPLKWVMAAVNAEIKGKAKERIIAEPGSLAERIRDGTNLDIDRIMGQSVQDLARDAREQSYQETREKKKREKETKGKAKISYGIDVARMGDDSTIVMRKENKRMVIAKAWSKQKTTVTSGKIIRMLCDEEREGIDKFIDILVKIDCVGVGAGVFDILADGGFRVWGIESAAKAFDVTKFVNLRAEIWWNAREIFERQYEEGNVLSIPDDDDLIEDLTGMKYFYKLDGRIQVEDKKAFKKRIGRSPDKGDSGIYCLIEPPYSPDEDQYYGPEEVEEGVYI